jgi:putative SbcD/Mre11-related phosphoesterase
MKFVTGQPGLLIGKVLVIADLHIGIEIEMARAGLKMPDLTERLAERVEQLIKSTQAKRLVILGDLKHRIAGASFREEKGIKNFVGRISKIVDIELVPGNHDGPLSLLKGLKVCPVKGIKIGNCWLTHGHTKLPKIDCKTVIIGHSHPHIEFRDKLGYTWTEPVWVDGRIGRKRLIVMPAFGFVGGVAVNRQGLLGPIGKRAKIEKLYLLDGTAL